MSSVKDTCTGMTFIPIMFTLSGVMIVHGEFTETPMMPVNVTLNEDVVFRCRHSEAVAYAWYVNGSTLGNSPPEDITPSFDTLTIVALPRNNNTMIECVAFILTTSGTTLSERAPPVTLIIPDNCGSRMVSTAVRSFIEIPKSQNVAEGVQVRFKCRHQATNTLVWEVDGILFNESSTLNATTFAVPVDSGTARHVLLFDAILSYHHTSIVCAAIFSNGCPQQKTTPALLLIQGPLRAISGVFRENLANQEGVFYFWEPPSTLDLSGVEPDIVYCVEVSNITCGADNLIASDCELTNPIYPASVGDGLDPSYVYEITVTPRSNVPGAANGSVFTRQEGFMSVEASPRVTMESSTGVVVEFDIFVNDTESERLVKAQARSYSIEIVSVDDPQVSVSKIFSGNGDMMAVTLNKTQHWTYTVFAYGCQLHPVSITKEISTFAVQNISVTSVAPGELRVTSDFISNTSAVGMLAIVYSNKNDSDIHYTEARLLQTEIHLTGLSGSTYSISVFILEENGLPFIRAAHFLQEINIPRGNKSIQNKVSVQYKLQQTPSCTEVTCTFLDSSTTDCVAMVHQRISQLSSSGLMNIESIHKFNRSGDTAHGCIEGVNLTGYQIGVIGGRQLMEVQQDYLPSVCDTECIVGSVIGGGLVIVVIIGILILSLQRIIHNKKRGNLNACAHEDGDDSDSNKKLPERTPDSNAAGANSASSATGDPVVVVSMITKSSAETIGETPDDSTQHNQRKAHLPAPFLGANNDDLPTKEPFVNSGTPSASSTATTRGSFVTQHSSTDPSNSENAEVSSRNSSLPTYKEETSNIDAKEGQQLNQEHSSGNGQKVSTFHPVETSSGMLPPSSQSVLITGSSTGPTTDHRKTSQPMKPPFHVAGNLTEDSQPRPFQLKTSIRTSIPGPISIVSREYSGDHSSSSQPVRSSLNHFHWPEDDQSEAGGSSNTML